MTISVSDVTWTFSSNNIISSISGTSPSITATITKIEWIITGSYTHSDTNYSESESGITYNDPSQNKIVITSGSNLTNEMITTWLETYEPSIASAKRNIVSQLNNQVNSTAIQTAATSITSLSSSVTTINDDITSIKTKLNEVITAINNIDGITDIALM